MTPCPASSKQKSIYQSKIISPFLFKHIFFSLRDTPTSTPKSTFFFIFVLPFLTIFPLYLCTFFLLLLHFLEHFLPCHFFPLNLISRYPPPGRGGGGVAYFQYIHPCQGGGVVWRIFNIYTPARGGGCGVFSIYAPLPSTPTPQKYLQKVI